jgi:hypothetical protein
LLLDPVCRQAVEAAEQYTEAIVEEKAYVGTAHLFDARRRGRFPRTGPETAEDRAWNALYCAVHRRWQSYLDAGFAHERWQLAAVVTRDAAEAAGAGEASAQATLLRDIFGNPFRPVSFNPAWRTPTVVALATAAHDNRILPAGTLDTDRLAVLADALEDAGCDNAEILDHCRGDGPHVRGCYVIDLLLGRS